MTAQMSDSIRFRDSVYSRVSWEGVAPFDPGAHALKAMMFSTACWQGYHCAYEVVAVAGATPHQEAALRPDAAATPEVLRLAQLFIGLAGEQRDAAERGREQIAFPASQAAGTVVLNAISRRARTVDGAPSPFG
jgi:hypothetical protein